MNNKFFNKLGDVIYNKNIKKIIKKLKNTHNYYIEDDIKLEIIKKFPKNIITMTTIFDEIKITYDKDYIINTKDRTEFVRPICRGGYNEESKLEEIGDTHNFQIGYDNKLTRVFHDQPNDDIITEKKETILIKDEISYIREKYEDVNYDQNSFPCETEEDYDIQEYFYNKDIFEENLIIYIPKRLLKFFE